MYDKIFLILYWLGFFLTTVLGHIGLKVSAQTVSSAHMAIFSKWGIICAISWLASFYFWTLILMKQDLISASSISNLRYPLICLAAYLFLKESLSPSTLLGLVLIVSGLFLIEQGKRI